MGSDGEFGVVELLEGALRIFSGEDVPAVSVHELDGGFEELSGFEFDECLQGREVFLLIEVVL